MTVLAKTLIAAAQAPAANTTQYTTPAATRTIIDKFTATNTTGAGATLTVFLVTVAGAAAATNTIIAAQNVAAGTCYTCPELVGHVLNPGDFIVTASSVNNALTIRSSGREVS